CEWKKVAPEPGVAGRATEEHAVFGYDVGEPLLDQLKTPFSYGYNYIGTFNSTGERDTGLGYAVTLRPDPGWPYWQIRANRLGTPAEMVRIAGARGVGGGDLRVW